MPMTIPAIDPPGNPLTACESESCAVEYVEDVGVIDVVDIEVTISVEIRVDPSVLIVTIEKMGAGSCDEEPESETEGLTPGAWVWSSVVSVSTANAVL